MLPKKQRVHVDRFGHVPSSLHRLRHPTYSLSPSKMGIQLLVLLLFRLSLGLARVGPYVGPPVTFSDFSLFVLDLLVPYL